MQQLSDLLVELGKRRIFVTCLTALTSIPVMGCCMFGLFGVLLPGMDELARRGDGNTAGVVLVALGLLAFVVMMVVPVGVVLLVTRRRARSLDAVFTPLGLLGERYLVYGRHYRGQTGGRDVDVYVYRGPTLEVRLTARAATRAQFFHRDSIPVGIAGALNVAPLAAVPGLDAYAVYPLDDAWTRRWLSDASVVQAIQTLMTVGSEGAIFRSLELQPGEVVLHLHRSRRLFGFSIAPEAARAWLSALEVLARAAEAQPAPAVTAQPFHANLRRSRERVSKFQGYAIGCIVFVMPVVFLAIAGLVFALVMLQHP